MIDSYNSARDEIYLQLASKAGAIASLIGYAPTLVYQGVSTDTKLLTDKYWYRVSQTTVDENQTGFRADYGSGQTRRYTSVGLVFVQLFLPLSDIANWETGLSFADIVKNAFRGKETENCIWFRNVRIQELPKEEPWNRINVVAEYTYDQIG